MASDHHHHHHQHRPNRISLPPRNTSSSTHSYPPFPYPPSTPTPTPSKHRLSTTTTTTTTSLSSLLLHLFSLRSLYSLLPFLRSSPSSFSIFPFSFLVSLLSFLLTLSFTLFTSPHPFFPTTSSQPIFSSSLKDPFFKKLHQPIFSITSLTLSQIKLLLIKSLLLAVVFLLRFQALRYCGTSAMILAELSGNVAARFLTHGRNVNFNGFRNVGSCKIPGFIALFLGLFMLSVSWDRVECFPLSSINVRKFGLSVLPAENCVRVWPMLLPFMSGFWGSYERVFMSSGSTRELGKKRVRLITLFFTTAVLFVPAVISMFVFEAEGDSISVGNLGWPLANTVLFGVLLSENFTDEKMSDSKDFQREYVVTFLCTLVLELFYFPELSLWGLLIAGLLLWISVRELDPVYSDYVQLGLESSKSLIMKPIRHILSERKSRKIALFLLINTAYMVVEFVAGFMSNSLGLISDACHMLFDCAALAIGLYASYISRLPANAQFNYGRGRFEVLSGYVNAVFLVLVGALIVLESMERILDPQDISTNSLLSVSIGGLLVNVVGLIFFHEEHHHAHGGSGSCSHSHSHSHSNHHHHHHHVDNNKNNESGTVLAANGEKSCSDHDQQCTGTDNEHHDNHECHKSGITGGCDHNHGHQHDHQNHGHQHDHQNHSHHHHHLHHHDAVNHGHWGNSKNSYMQTPSVSLESHKGHVRHESEYDNREQVLDGKEPLKQTNHHHMDHNMEGIFLHVLADTLGSVGVVISTLLIKYKGWLVADPACSIFISVLIVSSVIPLLRNSAEILLQRVPRAHEQDLREALKNIMKLKSVCGIQNFRVWSLTNTDVVGSLHLHLSPETVKDSVKAQVADLLTGAGIKDLTIHIEQMRQE